MKISFCTVQDLLKVRGELKTVTKKNQALAEDAYEPEEKSVAQDASLNILDIHEFDVTYYQRVCIDQGIRYASLLT